MAVISFTVGAVTVSSTITPAEAARVLALLQHDIDTAPPNVGLPSATPKAAIAYFLHGLLGDVSRRVIEFEKTQVAATPLAPVPV